MIDKQH